MSSEEFDFITIDNCKIQTVRSLQLQQSLEKLIKKMGSRTVVLYALVKESPEWFDHKTLKSVTWRMGDLKRRRNQIAMQWRDDYYWDQKQEDELRKLWPVMKRKRIAEHMGRTYIAIKNKARRILTKEEYANHK